MSHRVCRSLCRSQEKAGSGLAANTDHRAEPTIDRPTDGEIENGTDNGVVIPAGEGGAELLPQPPPTYPWQFAEKVKEIWVVGWAPACPRFLPSKPTCTLASPDLPRRPAMATAGCCSQGQAQPYADGEPSHPLCEKDGLWLAKPLSPLPRS